MLHALFRFAAIRLHREILVEIEQHLGKLSPEFFFTSNPRPDSVAKYQLPLVMDFLRQMKTLGHTAHYYQWFDKQKKQAANLAP